VLEADQEVRADARQLPEDVERDDVSRQRQPQHRGHEHQQVGVEAAEVLVPGEVAARVDEDERADAADQEGEEEAQPVEVKREIDPEVGRPTVRDVKGFAAGDGAGV
jgi:hypothetical protein